MKPEATSQPLIELDHVTVARGDHIVLHDISLRIHRSQSLAILGPNGCGKSTLLKTLTCECYPLARPETKVTLLGRERWDLTTLRRKMGVVSAELPGRAMLTTTAFDAILTGFFSSSTLWPNLLVTDAMRLRAEQLLLTVGAASFRDRPVGELSAGQQRRVMIARALAGNSGESDQLLLLDEPSNALDLAAQRDLRNLIRQLIQQGTTVILITHQVADIPPDMQRVLLMHEGRILADGPKQSLLSADRLSQLFACPITVTERDGIFHAT